MFNFLYNKEWNIWDKLSDVTFSLTSCILSSLSSVHNIITGESSLAIQHAEVKICPIDRAFQNILLLLPLTTSDYSNRFTKIKSLTCWLLVTYYLIDKIWYFEVCSTKGKILVRVVVRLIEKLIVPRLIVKN